MRLSTGSLAWSLLASVGHAHMLVNELSFGFDGRIAPEHSKTIPNFQLQGKPHQPEILSNKLVLTPAAPAPGNQRGAVWAERKLEHSAWTADIDFRVSGPDRGSGNLNIWLVKGPQDIGTSSVYTVGRFEGLVLVVDVSGSSSGGSLRGFLNDGNKDFKALTTIDGLAFGQCDFAYRNLGRPSQIKIRQTDRTFSVQLDGTPCFASDHVALPAGYRFGITAASADIPDSAEIFKLVVTTENDKQQPPPPPPQQEQQQGDGNNPQITLARTNLFEDKPGTSGLEEGVPDADADTIVSSKAQFADLHNRLQSVNHHLSTIFHQVASVNTVGEHRHAEVSVQLGELKGLLTKLDRLATMEDRLERMERDMKALHSELRQSLTNTEQSLKHHVTGNLAGHHDRLADELRHPGHSRLILVIVGGQIFLAVAYYLYKRRKASMPKKYL